jgi:hypothetical protein
LDLVNFNLIFFSFDYFHDRSFENKKKKGNMLESNPFHFFQIDYLQCLFAYNQNPRVPYDNSRRSHIFLLFAKCLRLELFRPFLNCHFLMQVWNIFFILNECLIKFAIQNEVKIVARTELFLCPSYFLNN